MQQRLAEEPDTEIWIWMGQNAHDVCGYYWFMSQFKDFAGRLQVLYLNNLPFFNEKGQIFYPTHLHQISAKELRKARKLARPITLSEFEVDPDEWKKLCQENAHLRLLEGGKKLVGKDWEVLDKVILAQASPEPTKLPKFLGQVMAKLTHSTGDALLVWRMRELAAAEKLMLTGEGGKGWKDILVATNPQHG
ncbi:MAG: DUF1835 domain-containing protein [Sphingobacteriia bacterium]|nr:MAG: DUF1835 domain-containing protein [Sphingobacteriia bacterium]